MGVGHFKYFLAKWKLFATTFYFSPRLNSSVVHQYTRPGVFTVWTECIMYEWHITAQKTITIQEPITQFDVIKCLSRNLSSDTTNCKALYGSSFQIQVEVKAGRQNREMQTSWHLAWFAFLYILYIPHYCVHVENMQFFVNLRQFNYLINAETTVQTEDIH